MKPASGNWYSSLGPSPARPHMNRNSLFTASLWVWITISFTQPHSSVSVYKSPKCFSDKHWRCAFHLYICSGVVVGFVGQGQPIERGGLLSWDLSRMDRKKICSLNQESFSTLACGRRHQPLTHLISQQIHVISLAVTGLIRTPPILSLGLDMNGLCELNKEVLIWQPFSDYRQTVS